MVRREKSKNDQAKKEKVAILDTSYYHETFDIQGWPWFSELIVEISVRVLPYKNLEIKCNILIYKIIHHRILFSNSSLGALCLYTGPFVCTVTNSWTRSI